MDKNSLYLNTILANHSEFNLFTLGNNSITFDGKTIELEDFDIERFVDENPALLNNLDTLSAKSIFDIINIHVAFNKQKKRKKEDNLLMEELSQITPILSELHMFVKVENDKTEKNYIHFLDSDKVDHVLYNVTANDVLKMYKELQQEKGNNLTAHDLYLRIKEKALELKLEDLQEAKQRDDASEQHINNLQSLNDYNKRTMTFPSNVVGNEEHEVYLNNSDIITMKQDNNGNRIQEKHDIQASGFDEKLNNEVIEDMNKTELISFNEYSDLILNHEYINSEEQEKINVFESFLFDLITYKDYLTNELYDVYLKFVALYEQLYNTPNLNSTMSDAKNRYDNMMDRIKNIQLTNINEKVMALQRINPKDDNSKISGFANAFLYITITTVLGILIAIAFMQ